MVVSEVLLGESLVARMKMQLPRLDHVAQRDEHCPPKAADASSTLAVIAVST